MASTHDLSGIRIIDADAHLIEPPDLWTSRIASKFGDRIPHVRWHADAGEEFWYFGDVQLNGVAAAATAANPEHAPLHPRRWADVDPVNWDAAKRLERMDEDGIWAQILYPNVAGFGAGKFITLADDDLALECVRAYNDYATEFCAIAPNRLQAAIGLPLWDVELCVAELARCAGPHRRAIAMTAKPEDWGQPHLLDPYWDPLWRAAEESGTSVSFHIASGNVKPDLTSNYPPAGTHANFAGNSVMWFLGNAQAVIRVITGGLCHRFPGLTFASVESGVGWVPFVLEALDWQWANCGVHKEHPEYDLLPSEYFRRQIYACFWFEEASFHSALEALGPGNILYETDFPHPTSMTPGPATIATSPRTYVAELLANVELSTCRRLLHDNAAGLYGIG